MHERVYDFWKFIGFFFVIEFQNYGSKHEHGLLWVANAPTYCLDYNKIFECFSISILHVIVINYHQTSMMSKYIITEKTCRKKNQIICCFNFPSLAMEETKILEPTSLENLFHLEKTRLNEMNNIFLTSLIKWTYKQHQLCHSLHS